MRFTDTRSIAISGFAADLNPNVTQPAAAKVYTVGERTQPGSDSAAGLMLVAMFAAVSPGGTFEADNALAQISFVLWVQDLNVPTSWFKFSADTAVHRLAKVTADFRGGGKIFIQVTATSGSVGADTVTVKVRET